MSKLDEALAIVENSNALRYEKKDAVKAIKAAVDNSVDFEVDMLRTNSLERIQSQRLRHATGALVSVLLTACYLWG